MGETYNYSSPADGFGGMLFRNANIGVFAANVAPHLAAGLGEASLQVAIVGSGGVAEPWSVAALLETEGITNYHIHAYDNSPRRLPEPGEDTPITRAVAGLQGGELMPSPPPVKVWDYFNVTSDAGGRQEIRLAPQLCEKITYHLHDIAAQPLPSHDDGYDVVIVNTLLQHYYFNAKQLVHNIMLGMRRGGVLVCNDSGMFKGLIALRPIPLHVSPHLKNLREAGTADTRQFYEYTEVADDVVHTGDGSDGEGLRGAITHQEQMIAGEDGVLTSVDAAIRGIEHAISDIKKAAGPDGKMTGDTLQILYDASRLARSVQGLLWFGASKLQSYRDSI